MNKKSKKILLFAYEYPPLGGGVATAIKQLSTELINNSNLQIDLITSSLRNIFEVEKVSEKFTIYKVPIGSKIPETYHKQTILNMFFYVTNSYLQAKNLLKNNNYDLAHFFGYPGAWQGFLLKKEFSLPYVVSLRGVDVPFYNPRFKTIDWFLNPFVARLWKNAEMIITNSRGLTDLARKTNPKINYQIICNGVDTDFFKSTDEKNKFKKFTVTAGGTIMGRKKGLGCLIEAFADFADDKKDAELLLIGDGDLEKELQLQIEDLNIKEKVKLVGRKNSEWLQSNLPKCHVFCLPSLNEGMSNATLEAMACGLPIIITPVGGSQELLNKNGFLVEKNNPREIVKKLELLYSDTNLRIDMGKASRQKAEKMNWQNVAKKYINIYKSE